VSHDFRTRMLPVYHIAYSCTVRRRYFASASIALLGFKPLLLLYHIAYSNVILLWYGDHVLLWLGFCIRSRFLVLGFFPLFLCFLLSECCLRFGRKLNHLCLGSLFLRERDAPNKTQV